ncbi:MAG TPA: T9SS type A sorting domain-containing protein [Moheibacter sp.]|nr:T9SS type A sorting domain-containing protein [Moheibacter sp.]
MKNLVISISLLIGLFVKAQQPELFDNDWYLTMITVDGEEFSTPPSDVHSMPPHDETSINYFTVIEAGLFLTQGCNMMDITLEDLDDSSFTVLGVGSTLEECMYPLYEAHDGRYFRFFGGGPDEEFPWEGFQYEIISNSDVSKSLVITNPNGDKAYYNNSLLSTSEISDPKGNFQIAFQNDDLIIKSPESMAKSVSIFDWNGKLILMSETRNEKVNVHKLPKGIYVVNIRDEKGNVYSKKVRRN